MIKIDENQDKDVTYENEPESQRQLFPNIPLTVDVSPLQDAIDALDERMDDAESDIDSIMTTLQTFDGQPGVAETVSDNLSAICEYIHRTFLHRHLIPESPPVSCERGEARGVLLREAELVGNGLE